MSQWVSEARGTCAVAFELYFQLKGSENTAKKYIPTKESNFTPREKDTAFMKKTPVAVLNDCGNDKLRTGAPLEIFCKAEVLKLDSNFHSLSGNLQAL